jgi:hypothetical protein
LHPGAVKQLGGLVDRAVIIYDDVLDSGNVLENTMELSGLHGIMDEFVAGVLPLPDSASEVLDRHVKETAEGAGLSPREIQMLMSDVQDAQGLSESLKQQGGSRKILRSLLSFGNPFRKIAIRVRGQFSRAHLRQHWPPLNGWGRAVGGLVWIGKDMLDIAMGIGEDLPVFPGPRAVSATVDGAISVVGGLKLVAGSLPLFRDRG